jgi:hypothetical protein
MLSLTVIENSIIDSNITECKPQECMSCKFNGEIPATYYHLKSTCKEDDNVDLDKFIEKEISYTQFSHTYDPNIGDIIGTSKCPRCGSDNIFEDY